MCFCVDHAACKALLNSTEFERWGERREEGGDGSMREGEETQDFHVLFTQQIYNRCLFI